MRMRMRLRLALCVAATAWFSGCSQDAVLEHRNIHFGVNGTTTFQHGTAGVFIDIAGKTRAIYEPADNVLATSSPLWSPDKRFVVFTTATAIDTANGPPNNQVPDWSSSPDGRVFQKQAVHYSCWLYDTTGDETQKPQIVFESNCGHAGYIAANLAVRWTPDGTGLAFVKANQRGRHELMLWNIDAQSESKLFPHAAKWLTFDFTSAASRLVVCTEDPNHEGVFIKSPDSDWWHVTEGRGPHGLRTMTAAMKSLFAFVNVADSPLERLRGLQPTWSPDHNQFAFATREEANETTSYKIHIGSTQTKTTRLLKESNTPLSDVAWHPNGNQLGFVSHTPRQSYTNSWLTSLQTLNIDGTGESRLSEKRIRQFAGWNSVGGELALVAPVIPIDEPVEWAFAMIPAQPGRESLIVSGTDGEREVFSGTRITFPTWSPDGRQIAFWSTITPARQSWSSLMRGGGLPEGDPAVTINIDNNELQWMPVSAIEELQIGHYYLLKGDNVTALEWYDKAAPHLPTISDENRLHLTAAPLYRSICLTRLGRPEPATAAFTRFEKRAATAFRPRPPQSAQQSAAHPERNRGDADMERYLFLLEVYLSVDAALECQQLLETQIAGAAGTPAEQLARNIALGQLLLLENKKSAYLEIAANAIVPLAIELVGSTKHPIGEMAFGAPTLLNTQLSLLPLLSADFLTQTDADVLRQSVARLQELREQTESNVVAVVLDKILHTAHGVTKDAPALARVSARLSGNPLSPQLNEASLGNALKVLRGWPLAPVPEPTDEAAAE